MIHLLSYHKNNKNQILIMLVHRTNNHNLVVHIASQVEIFLIKVERTQTIDNKNNIYFPNNL